MATNPVKVPQGETRDDAATTKQLDLADRLVKSRAVDADAVPSGMTKGDASDFISQAETQAAEAGNPTNPVKIPQGAARDEPASAKQLAFAERLANSQAVDGSQLSSDMTKGQASDFITDATARAAEQTLSSSNANASTNASTTTSDDGAPPPPPGVNPIVIPRGEARAAPASQAQRNLAERLAGAGQVDGSALRDDMTKGEISDFITEAQAATGATNPIKIPQPSDRSSPATRKQLDLATRLAASSAVDASPLSKPDLTKGQASDFISGAQAASSTANPLTLPHPAQRGEPASARQHGLAERVGVQGHEGMTMGEISDAITEKQKEGRQ